MSHPLHSAEFIENFRGHEDVGLRRTGRSTAQGLEIIARAIKRPHFQIVIADHHGTLLADLNLICSVSHDADFSEAKIRRILRVPAT